MMAPKDPIMFWISLSAARFQEGSVGVCVKRAALSTDERIIKLRPMSSYSRLCRKESIKFFELVKTIIEEIHEFF